MKAVRIIPVITTLAIMAVIFMFSAQSRETSSELSTGITEKIVNIFASVINMPSEEKMNVVAGLHTIVRKTAHFTLYLLLGLSTAAMFRANRPRDSKLKVILCSVVFCCLYAVSDELHQEFVSGRGPQVTDVIIDTAGAICGSIVLLLIIKAWRRFANDRFSFTHNSRNR